MTLAITSIIILSILLVASIVTIFVVAMTNSDSDNGNGGGGVTSTSTLPLPTSVPPPIVTTETLMYGDSVRLSRIDLETRSKKDSYSIQICREIDNAVSGANQPWTTGVGCSVVNALVQDYGDSLTGTCNLEISSLWIIQPTDPANIEKLEGTPVKWVNGIIFRHQPSSDKYLVENKGPISCSSTNESPFELKSCCADSEMSASGVIRKTYDTTDSDVHFNWFSEPGPSFNFGNLTNYEGFEALNRTYITSGDVISLRNASSGKYLTLCGAADLVNPCWGGGFVPAPEPYSNSTLTRDVVTGDINKIGKSLEYFQSHNPYWMIQRIK
jgi:hypothetical protein